MTASPCSICGKTKWPRTLQQLGPGEPSVPVCSDCDAPIVARDDTRGYQAPERSVIGPLNRAFARAANRISSAPMPFNEQVPHGTVRPGFLVVRVVRRQKGRSLDANEARETLRGEPWFEALNYIGTDARYHLFDRPDPTVAPVRTADEVMGELADAARKAGS